MATLGLPYSVSKENKPIDHITESLAKITSEKLTKC
jgi:hypothetical protein